VYWWASDVEHIHFTEEAKYSFLQNVQHDVHRALNDVIGKNLELKKIVTMHGMEGRLKSGYPFTIPDDLKALVGAHLCAYSV
jgi:hypothetical protein